MFRISALLIAPVFSMAAALTIHAAQGRQNVVDEPPGILVLAVDEVSVPYVRLITDTFTQIVRSAPNPPAVYLESLDASRFEGPDSFEASRDWLRRKYARRRIDLVVTVGDDALAFLARNRGDLWPDAAVLYVERAGVSVDTRKDLPRAGGVLIADAFFSSLAVIKTILPETKRLVIVSGASTVNRGRYVDYADTVRAANLALEPILWVGKSAEVMRAEAAHLPPHTVMFVETPYVDAKGRVLSAIQLCELFSTAANVPFFTPPVQDLGCGVVGGLLRDWTLVGRIVAEASLARLAGGSPDVVVVPLARSTTLKFDARQLARWNIPERRLPAGSTVLFREPNLWRDRRALVISAIAVTLAQALLIVGLVHERKRRQRAEVEGRRSLATMAHLDRRAALGELATSLSHELNQPLNAILQNAEAAQMMLTSGSGPPPLDEVVDILNDIQKDNMRAAEVIRGMRAFLQKQELTVRPVDVNAFARDTVALTLSDALWRGISVDLELAEELPPIQGERIHLQQVLLNLLLNGMDAVADMPLDQRRLLVRTTQSNGYVELAVSDCGTGIAADSLSQIFDAFYTTKSTGMGVGLSIARSIIEAHDGRMSAENNSDGGATVRFALPAIR